MCHSEAISYMGSNLRFKNYIFYSFQPFVIHCSFSFNDKRSEIGKIQNLLKFSALHNSVCAEYANVYKIPDLMTKKILSIKYHLD